MVGKPLPKSRNYPMTPAELRKLAESQTTTDVVTAGRAHGLGAGLSYQLAAAGAFPCRVIRAGRKLRVPTADLLRSLGIDQEGDT